MPIPDDQVDAFRRLQEDERGLPMSMEDARAQFTRLRFLWWSLSHRPPAEGDPPYEPPAPPWL
jgi:hypothetical protein